MSERDEQTAGVLHPMPGHDTTPLRYREIREEDRVAAGKLWARRWGEEWHPEDNNLWLDNALDDDVNNYYGVVAVEEADVIGLGICASGNADGVADVVDQTGTVKGLRREEDDHAGVMYIGVVDRRNERRGIGGTLFAKRLRWLDRKGVDAIFGKAWVREDHYDSSSLFERFQFEPVANRQGYYGVVNGRENCPDCGGECQCNVRFYRRELPGGPGR